MLLKRKSRLRHIFEYESYQMSHNFSQKFLNRSFSNFKAFERICYLKSFQKNHHLSKSVKKCGSYSDFSFWISTCGSWSNFFYKNRKFISQPILTNEYFSESSRRVDYFYEIIFIKMSHFQKILVMSHRIWLIIW